MNDDRTCTWVQDDDNSDAWGTQCRRMFLLIDGTPEDNRMKFCCYCGKPLVEQPLVEGTP